MNTRTTFSSPAGDHLTWKSCTRRPRRGSAPYNTKVSPVLFECNSQLLGQGPRPTDPSGVFQKDRN